MNLQKTGARRLFSGDYAWQPVRGGYADAAHQGLPRKIESVVGLPRGFVLRALRNVRTWPPRNNDSLTATRCVYCMDNVQRGKGQEIGLSIEPSHLDVTVGYDGEPLHLPDRRITNMPWW